VQNRGAAYAEPRRRRFHTNRRQPAYARWRCRQRDREVWGRLAAKAIRAVRPAVVAALGEDQPSADRASGGRYSGIAAVSSAEQTRLLSASCLPLLRIVLAHERGSSVSSTRPRSGGSRRSRQPTSLLAVRLSPARRSRRASSTTAIHVPQPDPRRWRQARIAGQRCALSSSSSMSSDSEAASSTSTTASASDPTPQGRRYGHALPGHQGWSALSVMQRGCAGVSGQHMRHQMSWTAGPRPPRACVAGCQPPLGCLASINPSKRRSTSSSVVCRCGEIRSDVPRTAAKQLNLASAETTPARAVSGGARRAGEHRAARRVVGPIQAEAALRAMSEVRSDRVAATRLHLPIDDLARGAAIAIGGSSNFVR
jgi:hypothetical protein